MIRLLLLPLLVGAPSAFSACDGPRRGGPGCDQALRFERERIAPDEPSRARPGSWPGFIDVGGGTELRVGGRTRFEYQRPR